jgi:AcrR family transcriptional regulator
MEQTGRLIKEKALELFGRVSFAKTSVGDIAGACGLGKGSVYLHFKSKEDILLALIEERIERFNGSMSALFEDGSKSIDEKIACFFDTLVDEYFAVKDLMFGDFENVRSDVLWEVWRKFGRYHERGANHLFSLVTRVAGFDGQEPERLKRDISQLMDLIAGHMLSFFVWNEWKDREALKRTLSPLSIRLFRALVAR